MNYNWSILYKNKTLKQECLLIVTLCGLEGFKEFMQVNILDAAMTLQHNNGCYGFIPDGTLQRKKRETNVIAGGCLDHTTGLGASVLGLFLKYYSQM